MIELERVRKPLWYFAIILVLALVMDRLSGQNWFFDDRGKLKQYGFMDRRKTPVPLVFVVVVGAVVATIVSRPARQPVH